VSSAAPLRVLTWHVHGSYLNYLSRVPVTWLLPVTRERANPYGGRGETFSWPDNVVEVPVEEVPALDLDVQVLACYHAHDAPRLWVSCDHRSPVHSAVARAVKGAGPDRTNGLWVRPPGELQANEGLRRDADAAGDNSINDADAHGRDLLGRLLRQVRLVVVAYETACLD